MTEPGAPRRGRHASPDDGAVGLPTSEFASPARSVPVQRAEGAGQLVAGPGWNGTGAWLPPLPVSRPPVSPHPELGPTTRPGAVTAGQLLAGRVADPAGHLAGTDVLQARHRPEDGGDDPAGETGPVPPAAAPAVPSAAPATGAAGGGSHPSGPLPPFPTSAWSRLAHRRSSRGDEDTAGAADEETQAAPLPPGGFDEHPGELPSPDHTVEQPAVGDEEDWDATGGLDVLGAHPDGVDGAPPVAGDLHDDDELADDEPENPEHGPLGLADDGPRDPHRPRRRRRRRWVAVLVSLVVLGGLALGIVLGGRQVLGLVNPPDYTGAGTGTVQIRVQQGDTLKAIGQTMVDQGVIASVRPFVAAAEGNPDATSISPGTYALRSHMSGKAALDLLLQPSSRLVSRVTLPEGLTAAVTLQKVAQATRVPPAQLQAAAADPAAIGLPPYAGGKVEGFLFPATYDFEPSTTPTEMLQAMVDRTQKALDGLAVPADQRMKVLTEASIVQAEGKTPDDMAKIARVLDNRLATGMPLQLDTTVNYANGKNGVTTTPQDRANPSPYNTYAHPGLPPGPIGNPGEDAIRAVLAPAQGTWLYFVVVNPDTGETRFATTAQEAQANTALFQQWLREHPGR